ncbi:MAG: SRPBCC family protein [Bacteroidales bacterium]|nr:SRPBCC family protein [Bacteroidales bacterium]
MELKLESRIGKVSRDAGQIYEFLSDFNHLSAFVPPDKVQDWQVTADTCSFSMHAVGKIAFRVLNREPQHTIKMAVETMYAKDVLLWVQLTPAQTKETRVKLTLKAEMNPMMKLFVSKPLQQFLDKIIDTLEAM